MQFRKLQQNDTKPSNNKINEENCAWIAVQNNNVAHVLHITAFDWSQSSNLNLVVYSISWLAFVWVAIVE